MKVVRSAPPEPTIELTLTITETERRELELEYYRIVALMGMGEDYKKYYPLISAIHELMKTKVT